MHLGLLKDCVGGHSYALKMRSSLLLIYVTHAVTYTLVISPTSPLTAWIMHVLTERWHLPLSPPSHVLFHKVYFIITDPCQPEMWSVFCVSLPHFYFGLLCPLSCHLLSSSTSLLSEVYEIAQQEVKKNPCMCLTECEGFFLRLCHTLVLRNNWHMVISSLVTRWVTVSS